MSARAKDRSPWKLGGLTWKRLAWRVWDQFWKDRVLGQAAQLSFYFLLALFPMLLFLTALLGLTLKSDAAFQALLTEQLGAVLPQSASQLVRSVMAEVSQGASGRTLSFGLLFSLWAASTGVVAIIEALNIAYNVKEARRWWKRRLVAIALTVGFGLLVASALLLTLYGERFIAWTGEQMELGTTTTRIWRCLQWLLLAGLVVMAFNLLYVYGPNVQHRQWHWYMPGTAVGVGLWIAASFGFKLYLHYFDTYTTTYGSIGAVIVLLLWFYMTGAAILLGGEVNSEIESASGSAFQAERG